MIERNPLINGNGRICDGKKLFAQYSSSYVEKATGKVFPELPEGAVEADYVNTLSGRLRCDQTGVVYECVHDVEDAPFTYTEVFPDPRDTSEIKITPIYVRINTNLYPEYSSTKTYAKGDRVTATSAPNVSSLYYTYESDFDDNTGNTPYLWGWSVVTPDVEENNNVRYVTAEEFNQILEEENGGEG